MANIKSQKKRNITNEKRRDRNRSVKSALRTSIKKFNVAVEGGDRTEAESALRKATKDLDVAASKGVIHRNSAANRKSALAKRFNSAG